MQITDETLMAYVDGELAQDVGAQVEQAMAADATLAARAAVFADTRRMVKQAHGAAPPAVSDDLIARVRQLAAMTPLAPTAAPTPAPAKAPVVDLASRRKPAVIWQMGIAASVALAIGLAGGWFAARTNRAPVGGQSALAGFAEPASLNAVARLASGAVADLQSGGQVAAIATFRMADGQICREYEYTPASGTSYVAIACNNGGGWDLRFAVATGNTGAGYGAASSLETLDAFLIASEAGQPMLPDDEARALSSLPADQPAASDN